MNLSLQANVWTIGLLEYRSELNVSFRKKDKILRMLILIIEHSFEIELSPKVALLTNFEKLTKKFYFFSTFY